VNTQEVIEKAWREALTVVPKPTANLGSEIVQLTIDMDMTLEAGRDVPRNPEDIGQILPGDVLLNLGNSKR